MEELLSLAEAAAELGVKPVTLRAAVSRGSLHARLFGKTYVTTRAEVERYRQERLGQPGRHPLAVGEPGAVAARRAAVDRILGEPETPRRGHRPWSEVKRQKGG